MQSNLSLPTKVALGRLDETSYNNLIDFHASMVLLAVSYNQRKVLEQLKGLLSESISVISTMGVSDATVRTHYAELGRSLEYREMVLKEISTHLDGNTSATSDFRYMVSLLSDKRLYATTGMRIPTQYPYSKKKSDIKRIYNELLVTCNRAHNLSYDSLVTLKGVEFTLAVMVGLTFILGISNDATVKDTSAFVLIGLILGIGMVMIFLLGLLNFAFLKFRFESIYGFTLRVKLSRDDKTQCEITRGSADRDVAKLAPTSGNIITDEERETIKNLITELAVSSNSKKSIPISYGDLELDVNSDDDTFIRQSSYIIKRIKLVWAK